MLNTLARAGATRVISPLARALLRLGVSPDAVTFVGTLGVCVGALAFYPRGKLFVGTVVATVFVFSDMVDGTMARLSGRSSPWGAFLDSTLDRIGDAALFGGLVLWFVGEGAALEAGLALFCLVVGILTSYTKARAEGLGMTADVGIAERPERLVVVLLAAGLAGLGVPYVLAAGLWLLAVAGVITVGQRMVAVRRQAATTDPGGR
jgi:CDP-diacylglycerol--glycerol-3-phosphate 3-phosphatidyltransferase